MKNSKNNNRKPFLLKNRLPRLIRPYINKLSPSQKEAIDFRMLQGTWFAYEGCYYGDEAKVWQNYNRPRIFEIRGNQYRSGSYDLLRPYKLKENLLILETSTKIDSAYINLLTADKMIISFKRGKDFESYKFSK